MGGEPDDYQEPRRNQPHRNKETGPSRRGANGRYCPLDSITVFRLCVVYFNNSFTNHTLRSTPHAKGTCRRNFGPRY